MGIKYIYAHYLQSVHPKCHFVLLVNGKTKFIILYEDFVSNMISIWNTEFKELITIIIFNKFLLRVFRAFIPFSIITKNGKRNTASFQFLNFMKELKNKLPKKIKINFMVIFASMTYTFSKASSCQTTWYFSLNNSRAETNTAAVFEWLH